MMSSVLRNLDSRLNGCLESSVHVLRSGAISSDGGGGHSGIVGPDDQYCVLYHSSVEKFAKDLVSLSTYSPSVVSMQLQETTWEKFNDGTDNIKIQNMSKPQFFKGKNVLFVASFHDNAVTLSQFHLIAFLCECLVQSLTVLLPYYPTGTMERIDIGDDGVIPTANTLALLFNGLPSVGRPIRVMTYDLHTLQNRFYFGGHSVATLHTAIPVLLKKIHELNTGGQGISAVAFPDEGAHKRFGSLVRKGFGGGIIICSKVREGDQKVVTISDGSELIEAGKHILIIDDQTKSGGTLIECAKALKRKNNGVKVSAFVTHAVCTDEFWAQFVSGNVEPVLKKSHVPLNGEIESLDAVNDLLRDENESFNMKSKTVIPMDVFEKFYCTDSFPVEKKLSELRGATDNLNFSWRKLNGAGQYESFHKKNAGRIDGTVWDKLEILSLVQQVLEDL